MPSVRWGLAEQDRYVHSILTDDLGCFSDFKKSALTPAIQCLFDGHVHTTASDGERTPRKLAEEVHNHGLKVVVSDHYSLNGAREAIRHLEKINQAGDGVYRGEIICGIEFTTSLREYGLKNLHKTHILGVGIDQDDKKINGWLDRFDKNRKSDIQHVKKIIASLEKESITVDEGIYGRLRIYRNVYKSVARSIMTLENAKGIRHLMDIKLELKKHRKNKRKKRLSMEKKIISYLRNSYGDFRARKPCLEEAVEMIAAAGGVAVIPHLFATQPRLKHAPKKDLVNLLHTFRSLGVHGIEAYHPGHRLEHAKKLSRAAKAAGLMVCGGSDAHASIQPIGCFIRPGIS